MKQSFKFTDSCIYDLANENQHDVNKLFGFSLNFLPKIGKNFIIPHHRDSCRFGWRPTKDLKRIEIVLYEYRNDERISTRYFMNVHTDIWYVFKISKLPYYQKIIYSISSDVNKEVDYTMMSNSLIPEKKWYIGYDLDFYFGGNETAPHDIVVYRE